MLCMHTLESLFTTARLHVRRNQWTVVSTIQGCKPASSRLRSRERVSNARVQGIPHDVLAELAAVAPICFDKACQANSDRSFLVAISIPLLVAIASIAYLLRPLPQELRESGQVFEDPDTGAVFEGPQGTLPARDIKGELEFKVISYTPWPVDADFTGERLRIPVGPVADRQPRTFVFPKTLPGSSELLTVSLPRPLGLVFRYDERLKRTVVEEVIPGTPAEQRKKMAGLNRSLSSSAILEGDVLRAVTTTNFVYPTRALFGAVPPERHVVVFGADNQGWAAVRRALRKGEVKDGEVTVVLERRVVPKE